MASVNYRHRSGTRRRPEPRPCSLELLESRTLLAPIGPQPRIINGDDIRGSKNGARIINGSTTNRFSSVGVVGNRFGGFCTGTLIQARHVLTAAHCVDDLRDSQARFSLSNGDVHASQAIFVHPSYDPRRLGTNSANDIAIIRLTSRPDVEPTEIFRGTPRVGQVLTLVGFGAGGTGNSGERGDFGTKRSGTTPIDGVAARLITWRFDNNRESNTAPGDSGGPAFLSVGNSMLVAGVTSGGIRQDAGLGDRSFDTRVDAYEGWIVRTMRGSDGGNNSLPALSGDDHTGAVGQLVSTVAIDGTTTNAALEQAGDRDVFQFQLSHSDTVKVDLVSSDGSLDTLVRIYDSTGNLVAQNDDSGLSLNSSLTTDLAEGIYYVEAGSFADRGSGEYELTVTTLSDDHGNSFRTSTRVAVGRDGKARVRGAVEVQGDRDRFELIIARSGVLRLGLKGLRSSTGRLDPVLKVFDSRGRLLKVNDDFNGGQNSQLSVNVRRGQSLFVQASGYRDSAGRYSLVVETTGGVRGRSTPLWNAVWNEPYQANAGTNRIESYLRDLPGN